MRRLPHSPRTGRADTVELDGEPLSAIEGEPAACALLAAGEDMFSRSVKYHRPRGASCLDAACSNCLMRVDGLPNTFTCKVPVHAGMRLERQNSFPSAKLDVFASLDWLFPKGLDHHAMLAGVPVAEKVMGKVARHLAGLGLFPAEGASPAPAAETVRTPVCVVGAGAAGLAASEALVEQGITHCLVEQEACVGGWSALGEQSAPSLVPSPLRTVTLGSSAVAVFEDEHGQFLLTLCASPRPRLIKIYASRFLFAVGGYGSLALFENNDLPGVYTSKAAATLLFREGLLPGESVALVGEASLLPQLEQWWRTAGGKIAVSVAQTGEPTGAALRGTLLKAHGPKRVRAVTVALASGEKRRVSCDAVIVAQATTPSFELPRQAGATIHFVEGHGLFAVQASADGATSSLSAWVAGDVAGPLSSFDEARAQGRRAAIALAQTLRAEATGAP
jgi:sarcosine oxidase, subunit alpha